MLAFFVLAPLLGIAIGYLIRDRLDKHPIVVYREPETITRWVAKQSTDWSVNGVGGHIVKGEVYDLAPEAVRVLHTSGYIEAVNERA